MRETETATVLEISRKTTAAPPVHQETVNRDKPPSSVVVQKDNGVSTG